MHGWLWNRLGNFAGRVPFTDRDVDFLPATKALHDAGYHVLLFDLRHHGESGRGRAPLTYGPRETRDYIGAVNYLRSRPDVDGQRIGALGTSMGGNTIIMGTSQCQPIKAMMAVQPTRLHTFNTNFARDELGPLGPASLKPIDWMYAAMRLPRPTKHDPGRLGAATRRHRGPVRPGHGRPVGDDGDHRGVRGQDAERAARRALPVEGRYEGYRYVSERTDDVVGFFREHL